MNGQCAKLYPIQTQPLVLWNCKNHEGGYQRREAPCLFSFNLTMGRQWIRPLFSSTSITAKDMTPLADTALGHFSLPELNDGMLHAAATRARESVPLQQLQYSLRTLH